MALVSLATWAAAQKPAISDRRARVLAEEGRIKGAQQIGRNWVAPENATRRIGRTKGKK